MPKNCSCSIDVDVDSGDCIFHHAANRKARKQHKCCECDRVIAIGEQYECVNAMWAESDKPSTIKTCVDCVSIRTAFFCNWHYGEIFQDLNQMIYDNRGEISWDCVNELTPAAKEKVLKMVDEYIEEHKDEDVA